MKKYFLTMIMLMLCIMIFAEFLIDSNYEYFVYIQYLDNRGLINLETMTFPMNSDNILYELSECFESGNDLNAADSHIVDFLIKDFAKREPLSIRDRFSAGITENGMGIENTASVYSPFISDKAFAQASFKTAYPYKEDSLSMHRLKEWNHTYSAFTHASVTFGTLNNFISAGRLKPSWGIGVFDNMFLSDSIYEPDCIYLNLEQGMFTFTYFSTLLTPYNYSYDLVSEQTYASFHKLDIRLPYRNTLSFKEAILYTSVLPEPYYINPFMIYYFTQWNSKSDDNIIWSMQFSNRTFSPLSFDMELFIDDFQYDRPMTGPDKLGFICSASYPMPFMPSVIAEGEYARITKWTGTHQFDDMKYTYYYRPMMYFTGPDSDLAGLRLTYFRNANMIISLSGLIIRKGEGTISLPYETEGGTMTPVFPSGTIESTVKASASFTYRLGDFIETGINMEYSDITNKNNIAGNDSSHFGFSIEGVVHL